MSENGPRVKKGKGLRPFLPVLGLLLLIALAAISFVLAPIVHEPLSRSFDLPENSEILIGGALFLFLLMFVSLIYAMFAPKPDKMVSERDLAKEREQMQLDQLHKRKVKRQINLEKAKSRENQNK